MVLEKYEWPNVPDCAWQSDVTEWWLRWLSDAGAGVRGRGTPALADGEDEGAGAALPRAALAGPQPEPRPPQEPASQVADAVVRQGKPSPGSPNKHSGIIQIYAPGFELLRPLGLNTLTLKLKSVPT